MKPSIALVCLCLVCTAFMGCRCSEKLSDEQRLKKQIDTTSVHLYVATKVAVAKVGTDPQIKEARDRLIALIKAAYPASAPSEKTSEQKKLSVSEMTALLKAVWKLKKTGARIVAEGKDDKLAPLLPLLLAKLDAPELVIKATSDSNTDHALFFFVTALLKIHPSSPIPLPVEIVLYEAWNTDADSLKLPGLSVPIHALKAWIYGTNDLCDLAKKEASAVDRITYARKPLLEAIKVVSSEPPSSFINNLDKIDAAARGMAHGGIALCHLQRGEDKKARPAMKRTVDSLEKLGASEQELQWVRAFIDCAGEKDERARGMARVKKLARGANANKEAIDAVRAYCEASDETSSELARKISLAGKLLRVTMRYARKHGGEQALQRSPVFKAVEGFAAVCEITAKAADGSSIKDKAKGLLDKLKK